MTVRTYRPAIQVALLRNIVRTDGVSKRYRGGRTTVDLTPFLGEQGGVVVRKSLYSPLGTWEVTLADQRDGQTQDTLYAMVEPMDGIEIRMARSPEAYPGGPPVMMRGFVTGVRRSESVSEGGRPLRRVVIEGADYGLPFARCRLSWMQETGLALLGNLGGIQAVGLKFQAWPAGKFVEDVTSLVINKWLDQFYALSVGRADGQSYAPVSRSIKTDITVAEGTVNPYGVSPFDRPAWEWMVEHADLTWNELFVEDRDDAPTLVYRPVPFKDINGDWIPQGASKVGADTINVDADAIMSMDARRSDANVANAFWVYPTATALIPQAAMRSAAIANDLVVVNPPNARVELYGLRLMNPPLAQGATGMGRIDGLPAAEQEQASADFAGWAATRQAHLVALNKDNVVFEDVSLALRGSEQVRPGRYLRLRRGSFESECYVHAVTHEFQPFNGYFTRVQAIRGTGLLARSKMQASPYSAEGRRGAYG